MSPSTEPAPAKKELVEPQTLKGFQDLLPQDMILRNDVVRKIQTVYERYGFLPIDTPILEHLTTLVGSGGEETNKSLFRLKSPEEEPVAMRFDLTVPFARLIAQYPEHLKLPFRRYHLGPVFRADKPGPGRFRQFTQFDVDAAGSASIAVDAEIVAAMADAMRVVGLGGDGQADSPRRFQIRINNRKLVDALLEAAGITSREKAAHVLRVVDKLQKVGVDNVRRELGGGRIDESGDPIRGVGLEPALVEKILAFIAVTGSSRAEVMDNLAPHLTDSETGQTANGTDDRTGRRPRQPGRERSRRRLRPQPRPRPGLLHRPGLRGVVPRRPRVRVGHGRRAVRRPGHPLLRRRHPLHRRVDRPRPLPGGRQAPRGRCNPRPRRSRCSSSRSPACP